VEDNDMMINKLVRDMPRVYTTSKSLWLLCIVLLFAVNAFSTITSETEASLQNEVDSIKRELTRLKSEYNNLSTELRKQDTHISGMEGNMGKLKEDDAHLKNELDNVKVNLLDSLNTSESKVLKDVFANRKEVKSRTILGILLITAVVSLLVVSWLLQKRRLSSNTEKIYLDIRETRQRLEEEGIKLDSKLLSLADKQLEIMNKNPVSSAGDQVEDHSLTLRIADEAIRIQMNLLNIDPTIKGHKQLSRAAEAILDNLNANGYEIPVLLNKKYDDRMKAVVTMILDDSLPEGERVIRRVLKPQVNYLGKMIQAAELVVAFND